MWKVSPSIDPTDPFMCSGFDFVSFEGAQRIGSIDRWAFNYVRVGNGTTETLNSVALLATDFAWTKWASFFLDGLILCGDNMDLSPALQFSRRDIALYSRMVDGYTSTAGKAAFQDAFPGNIGSIPFKPFTDVIVTPRSDYTHNEVDIVGVMPVTPTGEPLTYMIGPVGGFVVGAAWTGFSLANWAWITGSDPANTAALLLEVMGNEASQLDTFASNLFTTMELVRHARLASWMPSAVYNDVKPLRVRLLNYVDEGFTREVDMTTAKAIPGFFVEEAPRVQGTVTKIDNMIRLVLDVRELPNSNSTSALPGANFSTKEDMRAASRSGGYNRGSRGKRPYKSKSKGGPSKDYRYKGGDDGKDAQTSTAGNKPWKPKKKPSSGYSTDKAGLEQSKEPIFKADELSELGDKEKT
jgi:hypothetical protein